MRLPVKFLPRQSQHIGNTVGAFIIILMGLAFMSSYLPNKAVAAHLTFGEWIGATGPRLPFLLVAITVILFGLVALAIALINLLGGSPYNHLIVDRFGIQTRTLFSETRYSWKELGPIRPLRLGVMRAYGLDRRFWIVSDTFSGESRNDRRRPLSSFNLRIPVASYLGSSWLGGNIGPAMDATAAWLESLRKLAREEALNPDDVPDAPAELGPGQPEEKPPVAAASKLPASKPLPSDPLASDPRASDPRASKPPTSDLPAMADRKFGRRDGPTVER
jgi:hypothetical protein